MLLPRELIYRERRLEEFNLENSEDLFFHLYENLSCEAGMTPHDAGAYEAITKTLNNICYICTDAMLQPVPKLAFGDYVQYIKTTNPILNNNASEYVTIVINSVKLVFYFLGSDPENPGIIDLTKTIEEWLTEYDGNTSLSYCFEDYFEGLYGVVYDDRFITPRAINEEFLQTIDWKKLTNDYNLDCIRFIVRNISKDDNIKLKVIQSIRKEVSDNDPNQLPF